jgi:hypothetical protein
MIQFQSYSLWSFSDGAGGPGPSPVSPPQMVHRRRFVPLGPMIILLCLLAA